MLLHRTVAGLLIVLAFAATLRGDDEIASLVDQLQNGRGGQDKEAALRLAQMGEPAAIAILKAYDKKNFGTEVYDTLAAIGEPAIPHLLAYMKSGGVWQKTHATNGCIALEKMGPAAASAVPDVLALLLPRMEKSVVDDLRAPELFQAVGPAAKDARDPLLRLLGMKFPKFHERRVSEIGALQAIRADDDEVIAALIEKTDYEEGLSRKAAYLALGDLGYESPEAAAHLVERAAEGKEIGTVAAAILIMGPPAKDALKSLQTALESPLHDRDKLITQAAIARVQGDDEAALRVLQSAMQRPAREAKRAFDVIELLGTRAAPLAPDLAVIAADRQSGARRDALTTIGYLGTGARSAVPALIEVLADPTPEDTQLQRAAPALHAAETLGQIGAVDGSEIAALSKLGQSDMDYRTRMAALHAIVRIQGRGWKVADAPSVKPLPGGEVASTEGPSATAENSTTEEPDEPDPVVAAPRYKVISHSAQGNQVQAKILIDKPSGSPPTQAHLNAVWSELNAKTDKVLSLSFYVLGMDQRGPAWAVARSEDKESTEVRTFDSRLPK